MRARLHRPYIPLSVRLDVLKRQALEVGFKFTWAACQPRSLARQLRLKLEEFFAGKPAELHHRPALLNRQRNGNRYEPDANDPDYLVYLSADEHVIETRIRGIAGQYSDLALARKRKRMERRRARRRRVKVGFR